MPGYRTGSFDAPKDLDKTTTPDNSAVFIPATPPGQFTPAPDNDLIAWYDASKLTLANGAVVTLLPDQSGNGNDMTTSAGSPTCTTNGLNGKRTIAFAGGTQTLQAAPYLSNLGFHKPFSVVWLAQSASTNSRYIITNRASNATTTGIVGLTAPPSVQPEQAIFVFLDSSNGSNAVVYSLTPKQSSDSSWHVMIMTYDGLLNFPLPRNVVAQRDFIASDMFSCMAIADGVPAYTFVYQFIGNGDVSGALPVTWNTYLGGIGDGAAASSNFNGNFAELLFYRGVLGASKQQQLLYYFKQKWGTL